MKKQYSFLTILTEMSVADLKIVKNKNIEWIMRYLKEKNLPHTWQDAIKLFNSNPENLDVIIQCGGMLSSKNPGISSAGMRLFHKLNPTKLMKFRMFL